MQIMKYVHFPILEILYKNWPYGTTENEIIEYVRSKNTSEFDEDVLAEYMLELKDAQQIIENNQDIITDGRYYLTPIMYMAILKNSKESDSNCSKMS